MSASSPVKFSCGACGAPARPPFRPPQAESSPDLDMRPGEPARSTLRKWILTCPVCDACAPDLGRLGHAATMMMGSPDYAGLKSPRYAVPFLRWGLLCPQAERAEALLMAAWMADDAKDAAAAMKFRRQSIRNWPEGADLASGLKLVDVMRRAGDLVHAERTAQALLGVARDDISISILKFQLGRVAAEDSGRHLLASAVPPPAHRPHVAVGPQKPAKGFWSRLLGR